MPHTSSQRPALGIMFVLMSCSSLQFGAAFAVRLFPLFGALAISVSRLAIASMVVGSAVWLAARWRTRRGGEMPPGCAVLVEGAVACRHHFRYDFRSDERLLLLRD